MPTADRTPDPPCVPSVLDPTLVPFHRTPRHWVCLLLVYSYFRSLFTARSSFSASENIILFMFVGYYFYRWRTLPKVEGGRERTRRQNYYVPPNVVSPPRVCAHVNDDRHLSQRAGGGAEVNRRRRYSVPLADPQTVFGSPDITRLHTGGP